jgi:hypothetical protein
MMDSREWIIWDEFKGGAGVATIAEAGQGKHCRTARLGEPYANRGWFDLDELERRGRVAIGGIVVLSPEQWEIDREALHQKFSKVRFAEWPSAPDDAEHRKLLNLPARGPLYRLEIERAYRVAAKTSHPDGGGSEEQFRRVSHARNALLMHALD